MQWITDKIREHGEAFVHACIKFLHRRCPQLVNKTEDNHSKIQALPAETLTTMLLCLQQCSNNVSAECHEAIISLTTACSSVLIKSRQQQQPAILRSHRSLEPGAFNPTTISQLYNASTVDSISGIGTSLNNMNLSGPTGTAFNLQGGLGSLVSSPGSPSRILSGNGPAPSNSPFPMIPSLQQHQGPVGTAGASMVNNVAAITNLGRIGASAALEKSRGPESGLLTDFLPNVSKDIEDEANSYFQRIYNHPPHPTLSIDEVLDMLKRFQDSHSKRERDVSVHNVCLVLTSEQITNLFHCHMYLY